MINHLKANCPYCNEEYARSELLDHKENCPQNKLKPVIMNPILHSCCLYKQPKSNCWCCDGLKILNGGCADSGTKKKSTTGGIAWYCARCDTDYCEQCIQKYSDCDDMTQLKSFTRDQNMHLTHPHPLTLGYGDDLPEHVRKNCYGKYKKNGCAGNQSTSIRYLVCLHCKIVLCEKCYLSPSEDFLMGVNVSNVKTRCY